MTGELHIPGPAAPRPAPSPAGLGRGPAIALFTGGFLTCLGLVLSALALGGVIRPTDEGRPAVALACPSSGSASSCATASAAVAAATPASSDTAVASPGATENLASPTTPSAAPPAASPGATGMPLLVTPPPIAAPPVVTPVNLADGYALGPASAKVTVEVWEDFQCPFCRRFSETVEPQIISTYVTPGKVRYVFRDLPFLGEESGWAAVAARIASQQGKFWPFHDYLFANQLGENVGSFAIERLRMIADAVGLDRTAFEAGMQLEAARTTFAAISAGSQGDANKLGITSTPTLVVAGKKLAANDWPAIKTAIDAALAAAK